MQPPSLCSSKTFSSCPKGNSIHIKQSFLISLSLPLTPTNLLSISLNLPTLDFWHKWSHTLFVSLRLAYITKHSVFKVYPCYSICQILTPFHGWIPLCGYTAFCLFTCWWTFGLFLPFGEWCYCEHWCIRFYQTKYHKTGWLNRNLLSSFWRLEGQDQGSVRIGGSW